MNLIEINLNVFPCAGEPQKFDPTFRGPIHNRYASCPHFKCTHLTLHDCLHFNVASSLSVVFFFYCFHFHSLKEHNLTLKRQITHKQNKPAVIHPPRPPASLIFPLAVRSLTFVHDLVHARLPAVAAPVGPSSLSGLDESMTGQAVTDSSVSRGARR